MPATDKRAAYSLFALVVLTAACGNLSQTAVNAMMMGIVADMGVTVELGQWLSTGYMLMLGVAVPAVTWISKRFSARQHLLLGLGLSLAGSLMCLAAPGFWVLLAGRILQAVSTGILLPFMTTIAMVSFPPGRQATAMGIAGVAMGFAPNIGPTVGGAMASAWGWRSFFVLLAALTCVLTLCALVLVKPTKPHDAAARLDAVSLSLSTLGLGGVLLGFSNASSFALISPYVWGPLAVGVALCAAFIVRQKRSGNPLIDLGVFRSARFNTGFAAQNLLFASFMGVTLVVPLYVEGLCGGTALQAGMVLLPGTVAALVLNPLGGVLTDRLGAAGLLGGRAYALSRRRAHVLFGRRLAAVAGGRVPRRARMRRVAAHRAAYPVEPGGPAAAARAARQLAVHRGAPGLRQLRHVSHGAGYLGGAGDNRPRRPCRRAAGRA